MTLIFDLDGTLYRGAEPIPGAAEAVRNLKAAGFGCTYLTNNSGATREALHAKLQGMGFPAEPDEIYGTGISAGQTLLARGYRSAFVVGEPGLVASLEASGVRAITQERADAVLVGICRRFTYDWLAEAMRRIIEDASAFVATNRDATFPLEGGRFVPGAGSLVAAVATASGREPEFTIGKPSPELIFRIRERFPGPCLVIGDRLDTDIAAGENAKCPTLLVLSGVERTGGGRSSLSSVAELTPELAYATMVSSSD